MKSISADTRELIEQLYPPAGFWERIRGGRDEAGLLYRIAEAGEPAAVMEIISFVLSERREVARAAAAAVDTLFALCRPEELARLDLIFRERSIWAGRYYIRWHDLRPADLGNLESFGGHSAALLGAASFHRSGLVREEAVNRLGRMTGAAGLPFLLIRLRDWVHEVREAAERAVLQRISPDFAGGFVMNLPLVARLGQAGSPAHSRLVPAIEGLLKSLECAGALLKGVESGDRSVRRISFRLAAEAAGPDPHEILGRALADRDTVVRLWAARKISAELDGGALDKLLARMREDRFMPVRREALRAFTARFPERAHAELRRALLDPHASMREEARYRLMKAGEVDLALFYREALDGAEGRRLYAAVGGIGETGSAADAPALVRLALHESASIRGAAVRALSRLSPGAHLPVFVKALQDDAPGVSRNAAKALAGRASALGGDALWEIFSASALRHVRGNALLLLERLGKWEAIYFLIRAAADYDEALAERSRLYIQRWLARFNLSFTAPTREQSARLNGALRQFGHLLNETVRRELWFLAGERGSQ